MRCPVCGHADTKVVDARNQRDAPVKRRRRECSECGRRFTTYERIEGLLPQVVKRDGRREPYDRDKLLRGLRKACEKRPVSSDEIEDCASRVESVVLESGAREFQATAIGEELLRELRELDPVAWLRFASVYMNFKTIEEFRDALDAIES